MKRENVFPCRLCFLLVFHISLHFLISLVRQESRLISPHLASSSCCWILPLSSGISFCSTWKLPRYMLTFCGFVFFLPFDRILGFCQMPNHWWCFYLIISFQLLINIVHLLVLLYFLQSRGMDLVEVLSFLFQLSFSTLGRVSGQQLSNLPGFVYFFSTAISNN